MSAATPRNGGRYLDSNRKKSSSELAYEQIREMILHLDVKPGEKIPEEKIAKFVGGSRTPVREALRRLSAEGLVRIYPRRFAEVAYYDEKAVQELGTVRLAQDILACKLAIRYGSPEQFKHLAMLAERCQHGAELGNIYDRIVFDSAFHLYIAEIGGNQLLLENQRKVYLMVHLVQISKYTGVEDSLRQISLHQEILTALQKRDIHLVQQACCEHLQDFFALDPAVLASMMI